MKRPAILIQQGMLVGQVRPFSSHETLWSMDWASFHSHHNSTPKPNTRSSFLSCLVAELVESICLMCGRSAVWFLVESNQWLKNWYFSLPSPVLSIIRIEKLAQCQDNMTEWENQVMVLVALSTLGAALWSHYECALSQVGPVTSWYDFRCCQDVKLQQATNNMTQYYVRIH